MAVEVDIDVVVLKDEIKKPYATVSDEPERDFIFPTGRVWAEEYAARLERHGFETIESGDLINTYMRSKFDDTRPRALKFGAHGTTVKAYEPPT